MSVTNQAASDAETPGIQRFACMSGGNFYDSNGQFVLYDDHVAEKAAAIAEIQAELKRAREEIGELKAELNEARVLEKEASQMVNAYCGTLANIGDTLRVRGFGKQHPRQQVDEQVIRLAQAHDSLAAEVERLKHELSGRIFDLGAAKEEADRLKAELTKTQKQRDAHASKRGSLQKEVERLKGVEEAFKRLSSDIANKLPADCAILKLSGMPLVEAMEGYVFVPEAENAALKEQAEKLKSASEWAICGLIEIRKNTDMARRQNAIQGHRCDLRSAIDSAYDIADNHLKITQNIEEDAAREGR